MESLKTNENFKNCYQKGRSFVNRYLVLYVCGNGTERNRIGISVSKKVGNSVVRHRITRLIREVYRLHEDIFSSGLDMAVVARVAARGADYHEIESAFLDLTEKAKLQRVQQQLEPSAQTAGIRP